MDYSKQILIEFIDSFNSGELNEVFHNAINVIFEDSVASTSSDMYSDGIKNSQLNTTDIDEGTNSYLGSEAEIFNGDETDLIDELDLFNIENVTMHDADESLREKFHNTSTYQTIIPQIKTMTDSHKLMQSHMNRNDTSVKILKA